MEETSILELHTSYAALFCGSPVEKFEKYKFSTAAFAKRNCDFLGFRSVEQIQKHCVAANYQLNFVGKRVPGNPCIDAKQLKRHEHVGSLEQSKTLTETISMVFGELQLN